MSGAGYVSDEQLADWMEQESIPQPDEVTEEPYEDQRVICVIGSATWISSQMVADVLQAWVAGNGPAILITPDCPTGAEYIARHIWSEAGMAVELERAEPMHGQRAEMLRDRRILMRQPERVFAFAHGAAPGITSFTHLARALGIPVTTIAVSEDPEPGYWNHH